MEQPGLSFLMNLSGNGGNLGAAEAPTLLPDGSAPLAVNAFFTIHAGLAAGQKLADTVPLMETKNGVLEPISSDFSAGGNDFEAIIPIEFIATSETDGVGELYHDEVNPTDRIFFDQKPPAADIVGVDNISAAGIEPIEDLDIAVIPDEPKSVTAPQIAAETHVEPIETPAFANLDAEISIRGDDRALLSLPIEAGKANNGSEVKVAGEGETSAGLGVDRRTAAVAPAAPEELLTRNNDRVEPALPVGQKLAVNEAKPLDVAAFAASKPSRARNMTEPLNDIAVRDSIRDSDIVPRAHEAATAEAPKSGAAVIAQLGELKRQVTPTGSAVISNADNPELSTDEIISIEERPDSSSDAERSTTTTLRPTLTTTVGPVVAPVVAEGLAAEESFNKPANDTGAISSANMVGERTPIQFAPPTALPPAGAAWAQVISAISERNGETKLELRLNPPELGRVVIGFESNGAELIRAVVSADSSQTLDLMRRNLDILQRELARAGLDNIDVALADRDSSAHAQDANEQFMGYASSDGGPDYVEANIPRAPLVADGRLDLRV